LGYAFSKGKKCVALQTDPKRLLTIGNNPMIAQAITEVFNSIQELRNWLEYNFEYKKDKVYENCIDFMRVKKK
jgi:hypothetical protein